MFYLVNIKGTRSDRPDLRLQQSARHPGSPGLVPRSAAQIHLSQVPFALTTLWHKLQVINVTNTSRMPIDLIVEWWFPLAWHGREVGIFGKLTTLNTTVCLPFPPNFLDKIDIIKQQVDYVSRDQVHRSPQTCQEFYSRLVILVRILL